MVHRVHPLHDRQTWHDGAYVSLLPTESVDETGKISEESKYLCKNNVHLKNSRSSLYRAPRIFQVDKLFNKMSVCIWPVVVISCCLFCHFMYQRSFLNVLGLIFSPAESST